MSRYPDFPMTRFSDAPISRFPDLGFGWQVPLEPFNMSCDKKLQAVADQLLDTRWSNEEDDQCDREWRDAPERD